VGATGRADLIQLGLFTTGFCHRLAHGILVPLVFTYQGDNPQYVVCSNTHGDRGPPLSCALDHTCRATKKNLLPPKNDEITLVHRFADSAPSISGRKPILPPRASSTGGMPDAI
jgi:hypothetical protein